LLKRREIIISLSGFIPKADMTHVPPAANAHSLELNKTAVENAKIFDETTKISLQAERHKEAGKS
jgi:hypothetical protein